MARAPSSRMVRRPSMVTTVPPEMIRSQFCFALWPRRAAENKARITTREQQRIMIGSSNSNNTNQQLTSCSRGSQIISSRLVSKSANRDYERRELEEDVLGIEGSKPYVVSSGQWA